MARINKLVKLKERLEMERTKVGDSVSKSSVAEDFIVADIYKNERKMIQELLDIINK